MVDLITARALSSATMGWKRLGAGQIRVAALTIVFACFAALPIFTILADQPFWLVVGTRIVVFGLAAVGLNLILGFGAMVSFGHAMYIGIGAYAVGILSSHGVHSGLAHVGAGLVAGGLAAALIGAICLRASGVAFIMITLAFAQMFYFLAVGMKGYGGDDGLPIGRRSSFGLFSLDDPVVLYVASLVVLAVTVYLLHRLVHARFGMVLRGGKSNERRMRAMGVPLTRYRLVAYVISAEICVMAGILLANLTRFASPSYMQWGVSGELIVMVVLGGTGTLVGPVVGASVWLLLEELLTSISTPLPFALDSLVRDHWLGIFGLLIVAVVLNLKRGLYGSLLREEA